MIPSSHPHRPHGSSLSMETFGNPAIMGNLDFSRRSAFHLRSSSPFLIHRHRLSASYKIGVVSTDQLLVRPFFAYGKPDLRGFSDFRLHSQRRRFVPQTSPAGPPFTRVLQVLFVHPYKSPASRHRLLSLRNHLRSGPADPPERFSQGLCPSSPIMSPSYFMPPKRELRHQRRNVSRPFRLSSCPPPPSPGNEVRPGVPENTLAVCGILCCHQPSPSCHRHMAHGATAEETSSVT